MAEVGTILFSNDNARYLRLADILSTRGNAMKQAIDQLPPTEFRQKSDEALAQAAVDKAIMKPLTVHFDKATSEVSETDDGNLRATKTITFAGDKSLWHAQVSQPPHRKPKGDIDHTSLVVGMVVSAGGIEHVMAYIDSVISGLQEHLALQGDEIAKYNAGLLALALSMVEQRRYRLDQEAILRKNLGG
jgi:hypothetical protein